MKKLGFGCARLPLIDRNDQASIDMEQFCHMVDMFLGQGFAYFDTAYPYHDYKSEIAVREALVKRYPRRDYVLATKLPISLLRTAEDQERIFNEQLIKCGVEYFDVYLLHAIMRESYQTAIRMDSFHFLSSLKKEGKAKHIGLSYHDDAQLLDEILAAYPEMEYVQLQINYLDWESDIVQSKSCYEVARKHGRKVIVMEPVKGGSLVKIPKDAEILLGNHNPNMSVASWAIRYAAGLNGVEIVLSGMSDDAQMKDNINYMREFHPLSKEEHKVLLQATEIIKKDVVIPCTSCHYCTTDCPKKIPIPEYFTLYNIFRRSYGNITAKNIADSNPKIVYDHYFTKKGKASDCIGCLQCEKVCPQHLPVTRWLKEVAQCMEGMPGETLEEEMERKQDALLFENARYRKKYDLLCQWMRLKFNEVPLMEFFENRGIKSVAIYGAGDLGIFLYEEMRQNPGFVKYILDKNAGSWTQEKIGIPIYSVDASEAYEVGAVIITPVLATDEIEDIILRRFPGQVIFELEEVLYELCKEHGMKLEIWGL